MAFPERSLKLASALAAGDFAVIYLTGAGKHASALAGMIEVRGEVHPAPGRSLFDELYPLKVPAKLECRGVIVLEGYARLLRLDNEPGDAAVPEQ